jgi:hypothetical protein
MTKDQMRDLLREMRDEPIPPDTRVRVRAAVAERIQSGSWVMIHSRWRIAAVLLATASIVAVVLFLWPSRAVHEPTPGIAARQRDAPFERATLLEKAAPAPVCALQRPKHPARHILQTAPHKEEAPAAGGGVVIRIETPDPDVIIVLVGD